MATSRYWAFFFPIIFAVSLRSQTQTQNTQPLTIPNGPRVIIAPARPHSSLSDARSPVESVPEGSISKFDYQEHMAFQKNEDNLSGKIDNLGTQLGARVDAVKVTQDEDHKDIGSLKETRSSWQSYIAAGGFIWAVVTAVLGLTTWFFNKEKIKAFLASKLQASPPSSGPVAP